MTKFRTFLALCAALVVLALGSAGFAQDWANSTGSAGELWAQAAPTVQSSVEGDWAGVQDDLVQPESACATCLLACRGVCVIYGPVACAACYAGCAVICVSPIP